MNAGQRNLAIKDYLLRERLVDNEALGRVDPLTGRLKVGYSTRWMTSAYEEFCRIVPDVKLSECDPFLEGFTDYQASKYWCRVTKEDLERFTRRIAESSYALNLDSTPR